MAKNLAKIEEKANKLILGFWFITSRRLEASEGEFALLPLKWGALLEGRGCVGLLPLLVGVGAKSAGREEKNRGWGRRNNAVKCVVL